MRKIFTALALLMTCVATPAPAYDAQIIGRITMIEPTFVPSHIVFKSDNGAGSCVAGALLSWPARGNTADEKIANIQAILAMLQTAKATAGNVAIYVSFSNCSVEYIHFL